MLDAYIIDWRRREEGRREQERDSNRPTQRIGNYVPIDPWADERRRYEENRTPSDGGVVIVDLNLRPLYQSNLEGRL